jgi:hypothetical protein
MSTFERLSTIPLVGLSTNYPYFIDRVINILLAWGQLLSHVWIEESLPNLPR